jgi:hypothetical protein
VLLVLISKGERQNAKIRNLMEEKKEEQGSSDGESFDRE